MSIEHLDYEFDEEARGFGEPAARPSRLMPLRERLALAAVVFGIAVLLLQWTTGWLIGGWLGVLLPWVPTALGTSLYFRWRKEGTPEGIDHDGTFFTNSQNRGWIRRRRLHNTCMTSGKASKDSLKILCRPLYKPNPATCG